MRVFGGLVWPIDGNPAFFCIVTEKHGDATATMETPGIKYIVSNEQSIDRLEEFYKNLDKLPHVSAIYIDNDKKYHTYMRDINRWRREKSLQMQLRSTGFSSFEAGMLKIKDYIAENLLEFDDESLVRRQLKTISKASMKNEKDYYAVGALCNALTGFKKAVSSPTTNVPKIKGWY